MSKRSTNDSQVAGNNSLRELSATCRDTEADGSTALAVFGTFGLVLYVYPYLGLAFIPLTFFFVSIISGTSSVDPRKARVPGSRQYLCASFYRQTSREIKRVDSISRSFIYSSFGEQVSQGALSTDTTDKPLIHS